MVETQTKNQNVFWLWSNKVDWVERGDVSYWLPQYEEVAEILNKTNSRPLADLSEIITKGETPRTKGDVYVEAGVPFIRVTNISEEGIKTEDLVKISQYTHSRLKRSIIKPNDIVFSMAGTIGVATVISDEINEANINQAVTKIRLKKEINPVYVSTFLNSKYGRLQSLRFAGGGVQKNIDFHEIKRIRIFLPTPQEQRKVEQIVKEAFQLKKEAEADYQKAQQLLNEAMGLIDVGKKQELSFWRWSDEIDIIARIDPDYYRKGYIQLAKSKSIKLEPLSKFIVDYSGGYTFETEKYLPSGIPIIRIKDLNYPEVKKPEDAFFADLPEFQRFTAKPDDILISMSGTIGLSAIIPKELSKCYVNQRITAITTKGINRFYLLAFLNSSFYREELEKIGTGGVQTNVSYKQIVSLPIPRLGDKEETIGNLLRGFIEKNKESRQKFQEAKDFVENLVKKG